jgi:hypothetical protein
VSISGEGILNAIVYVLVLAVSIVAGLRLAGRGFVEIARRPNPIALLLWLIVAVPSIAQFPFPGLLLALRRDPELIRDGQVWRLVTSAVVQDGGPYGTLFNLIVLAAVAMVAVRVWGGLLTFLVFLLSQLAFGLIATFALASVGAGNSAATFGLATSLAGLALFRRLRGAIVMVVVIIAGALVLLWLSDAHAYALLAGLMLGAGLSFARRTAPANPPR